MIRDPDSSRKINHFIKNINKFKIIKQKHNKKTLAKPGG